MATGQAAASVHELAMVELEHRSGQQLVLDGQQSVVMVQQLVLAGQAEKVPRWGSPACEFLPDNVGG
ncbi:hypothetical protein GCM10017783_25380 [Deinococcus piscis]|uniref:Uncharacterized protein n=1 Tax=Deinococcus piscis TaxID=394230 RepID=A0ABQ3KG24_9DEIO|nr:hypothetical protein [Deinococcus piscis]GHG12130.1 hypothetical protein GCM10017783_25380 [Deinococcus piscis]